MAPVVRIHYPPHNLNSNVMNILAYITLVLLLIGFCMTMFSKETSNKRYIGWIIMAMGIIVYTIIRAITGDITVGVIIFNIGIGMIDFFLAYFWYGKYEDAKFEKELKRLNNREKFLREIKRKKW